MHQALGIAELLHNIFQWCDKKSNVSNASVCKLWQGDALGLIWHEITDLRDIFRFLGPMSQSNRQQYFSPPLTREKWVLFQERYAWRVQRLRCEYMDTNEQYRLLPIFDTIARLQHFKPVFPNLQAIDWRSGLDGNGFGHSSVIFMQSSVTSYHLTLQDALSSDIMKEYLAAVSDYMPGLTVLQVEVVKGSHEVLKASLKALLKGLPSLESLTLPSFTDLSHICNLISSCSENLRTLQFTRSCKDVGVERMVPLSRVGTGELANLTELSLHTSYKLFTHFSRETRSFAPRLSHLKITSTSTQMEAPSAVKDLLEVICHQFSAMEQLALLFNTTFPPARSSTSSLAEAVHFVHVEPILGCSKITHFEITHPLPLVIREEELAKVGSSWPALKSIILCDDPQVHGFEEEILADEQLSLRALLPLSRSCPLLEEFRVPIIADVSRGNSAEEKIIPFQHLIRFSPGKIPFERKVDVIGVAMFLSQLLPTSCEIKFDMDDKAMRTWWETWNEVKKGLLYIEEYEKRGKVGNVGSG